MERSTEPIVPKSAATERASSSGPRARPGLTPALRIHGLVSSRASHRAVSAWTRRTIAAGTCGAHHSPIRVEACSAG